MRIFGVSGIISSWITIGCQEINYDVRTVVSNIIRLQNYININIFKNILANMYCYINFGNDKNLSGSIESLP